MSVHDHITIAPLTSDMVNAMAEIEKLCFSTPWSVSLIERELAHSYSEYWAALSDGVLVGYAGMNVVLDEGYITNVAVHPDHRRRRIASILIERLIESAKKLSFLTLEVRQSNTAAIELYKSFGFEVWGVRPSYYDRPKEDALLMTRPTPVKREVN